MANDIRVNVVGDAPATNDQLILDVSTRAVAHIVIRRDEVERWLGYVLFVRP